MILAALLALAAAGAPQQPPAANQVRLQISPAGQELVKKTMSGVDPQIAAWAKQMIAIGNQIDGLTRAPKLDLVKLEALLQRQGQIEGAIRARNNARMLGLLKGLSESDRLAFLRSMADARRAAMQAQAARR